jgi:uncharacterized membrane protein
VSIEEIEKKIEELGPEEKQQLLSDVIAKFRKEVFKGPR